MRTWYGFCYSDVVVTTICRAGDRVWSIRGKMINIYGTIGPACANPEILQEMFREGMTGMRLNSVC